MPSNIILSLADRTETSLAMLDEQGDGVRYLRVSHDGFGRGSESLMQIAHRHRHVYDLTVGLADRGFMVYMAQDSVSRLVRDEAIRVIWQPVKDGLYRIYDDRIVYSLEIPDDVDIRHLFITFSDVSASGATTSLSRYFSGSVEELKQDLPKGTAILAIADIGGVAGTLHLNSERYGSREKSIEELIRKSIVESGVDASEVTICGRGTGGVAAIYYASIVGATYVVLDPFIPANDIRRPWHNCCFISEGVSLLNKVRMRKRAAGILARSSLLIVPGIHDELIFSAWTDDVLSMKDINSFHLDTNTAAVYAAYRFALSLRAQGLDVAQLQGGRW